MFEVEFPVRSPALLAPVVGEDQVRSLVALGEQVHNQLKGRRVVSINSTAAGGGVAEMLPVLLSYASGVGVECRWLVVEGNAEFFEITKRLHNRIHGERGDGGPLGSAERDAMIAAIASNEADAARLMEPGDVVLIHDPQPTPLAAWLSARAVPLIWRCHIGFDHSNQYTEQAWEFLRPLIEPYIDQYVFTRREYAPEWVPRDRLKIIRPALDPFASKNIELDEPTVLSTLQHIGIVSGSSQHAPIFNRPNGTSGRVTRTARIVRDGPAPQAQTPLVVQVSRWDPLKDMAGVMHAFAHEPGCADAYLVLAGPDVESVTDDPEGKKTLSEVTEQWRTLPESARSRIAIVCLPMDDPEENAIMVNALQRHAAVVVQKSLKEGFGLTVAEAMFKGRPMVASAVGGIVDQVRDGVDGLLVQDPHDLTATGAAIASLLDDRSRAEHMGRAAHESVVSQFLPDTSLTEWARTLSAALASANERVATQTFNLT